MSLTNIFTCLNCAIISIALIFLTNAHNNDYTELCGLTPRWGLVPNQVWWASHYFSERLITIHITGDLLIGIHVEYHCLICTVLIQIVHQILWEFSTCLKVRIKGEKAKKEKKKYSFLAVSKLISLIEW